ncbi:MAG: hypothetical protein RL033_7473 [Pseudomonadota bacterium]|jgi:hypothetical protein
MSWTSSSRAASGRWRAPWALLACWLSGSCAKPPASVAPVPAIWPASYARSSVAQREQVAVTVYNSNLGLVREQRTLQLGSGRVALAYEDVSAHIQPASVHLTALGADAELAVLEQNYRYDLLTPSALLDKYVGRQVSLARYDRSTGADVVRPAEVLASANGPVLRVGEEIISPQPNERISFPQLPPDLLPRPTLFWLLDSARAEQRVEVTYLTSNLSWHADYVLVLDPAGTRADLSAWVTLENQTGTSFLAAKLQLVAGEVHRAPAPAPPMRPPLPMQLGRTAGAHSAFSEAALLEYHLYDLERPTDLLDKEQKQLQLLEPRSVVVEQKLVLRALSPLYRVRQPAAPERPALIAVVSNRSENGLGLPLPAGVVRTYRADAAGAQQFVGEDHIEHTPRDEKLEITLGRAFDVIAERRLLSQRQLERCVRDSELETELRNHKDVAVTVEVVEPGLGDWSVRDPSHPVELRDANTFAFQVPVPARGTSQLRYHLRQRTCGN